VAQQAFNNWNSDACGYTDLATFTLDRAIRVQRIDIWFNWRAGESSIRYKAMRDGTPLAEGELARAECDPYQASWCVARVEPRAELESGVYTFRTDRAGICQNSASGGQGFVRVFETAR
jgi:hypothetical protein